VIAWLAAVAAVLTQSFPAPAPAPVVSFVQSISGVPTVVSCRDLSASALAGETFITAHPVVWLDTEVCVGVLLWRKPQRWVDRFEKAHPSVPVDSYIAVGVVSAAHEATHAKGVVDETDTQCAAMRIARPLLGPIEWRAALYDDGTLPAAYHTHPCVVGP
jgi:hypothetical protein